MKPRAQTQKDSDHTESKSTDIKPKFRMSGGRFRLAFEKAPIGLAIIDSDYYFRRVNKSLCDALGYDADELIGRRFVDLTHPDDIQIDTSFADKLFSGELSSYRLEQRFLTKTGELAWLDLTAIVIRESAAEPPYGLAMVENVTARRRMNEALRTSEERYRSFVVNSSEGIWRMEIEQPVEITLPAEEQISLFYKFGYLAECNDAFARMCGHKRAADLVGARFGEFAFAQHPTSVGLLKRLITSNYRLMDVQTEKFGSKGETRYFSTNLIGIVINNMLLRLWGVQSDRTEQQTAELELERSRNQLQSLSAHLQALRERERTALAREIHDSVGQGLAGIKIDLSLLRKHLKTSDASVETKLEEIEHSINETMVSVRTLATELRPGVLDKFGLAAAIEWQCEEFQRRFNIACHCKVPQNQLPLSNDVSTALFRILQEALTNVATHAEASSVQVALSMDQSNVFLLVSDNGRGITLNELGAPTSLGLLGMSERARIHDGKLSINGRVGHGTNLKVSIPLKEEQND